VLDGSHADITGPDDCAHAGIDDHIVAGGDGNAEVGPVKRNAGACWGTKKPDVDGLTGM
jgi:hypothetical protein